MFFRHSQDLMLFNQLLIHPLLLLKTLQDVVYATLYLTPAIYEIACTYLKIPANVIKKQKQLDIKIFLYQKVFTSEHDLFIPAET